MLIFDDAKDNSRQVTIRLSFMGDKANCMSDADDTSSLGPLPKTDPDGCCCSKSTREVL